MRFDEFVERIKRELKEYLPEEYQSAELKVYTHQKTNQSYEGLILMKEGTGVSPVVNLDDFYWDHSHGRRMDSIMGAIAEMLTPDIPQFNLSDFTSYEKVKHALFIRVCDAERNVEYLSGMPHKVVEDMAVTYHIRLKNDQAGVTSTPVTDHLLAMYGVSKAQLHHDAIMSSQELFPLHVFDMQKYIMESKEAELRALGLPEERIQEELKAHEQMKEKMFVVSNEQGVNGAAAYFYPGVKDYIAELFGSDYLVLPSSVHEMILLKDDGGKEIEELKEMVTMINAGMVDEWDQLTDQVYHYDKNERVFETGERFQLRMKEKELKNDGPKRSVMETLGEKKEEALEKIDQMRKPGRDFAHAL